VRSKFAALAGVVVVTAAVGAPAAAADDKLPDLGLAPLSDFTIDTGTISGHKLLRYTALAVNTGVGPFEVIGSRPSTATSDMSVVQRIYDTGGGSRTVPTAAAMYYAGDGHNHWHVRDLEQGVLTRSDTGQRVAALAKHGFCFRDNTVWDLSLPGAPSAAVYTTCGTSSTLLTTTIGLSVGWGDRYSSATNYQWIDITGLKNGRYRLTATADPANWFFETNDANNSTWTDLRIRGGTVSVLASGS
jgi:hypothetical protein